MTNNRKPWHWHERQVVREHYRRMSTRELAARLGRTIGSVTREAGRLGMSGENHRPWRWTKARKQRFCEAYARDPAEAAERFGLTRMSANSYASRWGYHIRRPWSSEEDAAIALYWPQHRDEELLSIVTRSKSAITNRAYKLGLRRPALHDWTKWRFSEGNKHG